MRIREAKEYPWGKFTLWVYPEDELTPVEGEPNRYRLDIPKLDTAAQASGHRDRFELYWNRWVRVTIPPEDLLPGAA